MTEPEPAIWFSAVECDELHPDKDYPTTIDNLENGHSVSTELRCWHLEQIAVQDIDPYQLNEERSEDEEDKLWIDKLRHAMRSGAQLPPVILIHDLERDHPYNLIEGQHRYNAAHREAAKLVSAWVAHPGCCGGPAPDL